MAKPLKFHQTLNQAPRSLKHGQYRRPGSPAHRNPAHGAGDSTGGADQGNAAWTTINIADLSRTFFTFDFAEPEPKPPAIPNAGIRTGELIGHRLWWVIDGNLCSLAHKRLWAPGETVHGDTGRFVYHDYWFFMPIWGGTYSFFSPDQMVGEIAALIENIQRVERLRNEIIIPSWEWSPYRETQTFVAGTIKMWGDVIEHERGYRAEFAKLNSLDVLYGPGDLDTLRARYGVGVHTSGQPSLERE